MPAVPIPKFGIQFLDLVFSVRPVIKVCFAVDSVNGIHIVSCNFRTFDMYITIIITCGIIALRPTSRLASSRTLFSLRTAIFTAVALH